MWGNIYVLKVIFLLKIWDKGLSFVLWSLWWLDLSTQDQGLTWNMLYQWQCYKTFYGRNLSLFPISYSVCAQASLSILVKCLWVTPGAYHRVEYMNGASLASLTRKQSTRLERLAMNNHFSLLQTFLYYVRKELYNIGPRGL